MPLDVMIFMKAMADQTADYYHSEEQYDKMLYWLSRAADWQVRIDQYLQEREF